MKTLLISNIKGGCGKTTTAVNLAYILARDGNKVLFIDSDFQMNSTYTLGAKSDGVATLYDVLIESPDMDLNEVIQQSKYENLSIIAADDLLTEAMVKMLLNSEGQYAMQDLIERVKDMFDYAIIDTNPQADIMLRAGMIAADEMIIPVFADSYSVQGMSRLNKEIIAVKKRINPKLNVAGILLCNFEKRTNIAKNMKDEFKKIAELMGTQFFETVIVKDIKVSESVSQMQMPVVAWKPNCNASMCYEAFAEELEKKGII